MPHMDVRAAPLEAPILDPPMLTPRGAPRQSIEHFPAVAK